MSRHRNIRAMDYDEEYDEYFNNSYGQSVEEEFCISPGTEAQFMYNRRGNTSRDNNIGRYTRCDSESVEEVDEPVEDNLVSEHGVNANGTHNLSEEVNGLKQATKESKSDERSEMPHFEMEADFKDNHCVHNCKTSHFFITLTATYRKNLKRKKLYSRSQANQAAVDNKGKKPQDISAITDSFGRFAFGVQSDGGLQMSTKNADSLLKKPEVTPIKLSPPSKNRKPSPNRTPVPSTQPRKQPKADVNQMLLEQYRTERAQQKPLLNMVVIGHVDAGKSTLMGHLLYRLQYVKKKEMHRYETDAKNMGKASFLYAWILDETAEERSRGITMDIAQSQFETANRCVTLLDAPGHKDFIPNMITGAAQADVALLVIDATKGEFEAGFDSGGQTQEHTLLVRSLGVNQLGVVINKLDNVNWNQNRYDEIVRKLQTFLKQVGFKEDAVTFVPCSGLTGENLTSKSQVKELTDWYSGPCLLDVIDAFKPPDRLIEKPFRLCISDVFKGMGSGISVSGRVEAGGVQASQKLVVMPVAEQCTVKAICVNFSAEENRGVNSAFAGDQVTITLTGCDPNNITIGSMLCDALNPSPVTSVIEARIVVFHNIEVPLTKGFPVALHYKCLSESAVLTKLISQLNKSTGEVVKRKPRFLAKNSSAEVQITINRPICVELYQDYKELGRFMLRSKGATIAAGMITKIL
ncbi:HBS1-like protein [Leptotrombidium deliense]|uniref:HBS1-like protein n=1 Tax=Leptotrombidium deliense TaxID=299467 RepID=A0A443SHL0_9ACAR|nr:HBS1-like protein [Leptotrombidium deliense]